MVTGKNKRKIIDTHDWVSPDLPRESGVALILSLMLLTILIVIVSKIAFTAKVDTRVARNSADNTKLYFAARGTLALTRAYLGLVAQSQATTATPAEGESAGSAGTVHSLRQNWAREQLNTTHQLGDVSVNLTVEDCERRLNVNLLAESETRDFAAGVLLSLCERLALDDAEAIAEAMADHIDSDTEGTYEKETSQNGPLLHISELLAIKDIPETVWTGQVLDDGTETAGLLQFLTACGSRTLNINTMDADLFWAALPATDAEGTAIDRDAALAEIQLFRTGSEEGEVSEAETEAPATGYTANTATEIPGEDFEAVDKLTSMAGLSNIFKQITVEGKKVDNPLKKRFGVQSTEFMLDIVASHNGQSRHYESSILLFEDAYHTLLWRELP